jgi:hypothetical protein
MLKSILKQPGMLGIRRLSSHKLLRADRYEHKRNAPMATIELLSTISCPNCSHIQQKKCRLLRANFFMSVLIVNRFLNRLPATAVFIAHMGR